MKDALEWLVLTILLCASLGMRTARNTNQSGLQSQRWLPMPFEIVGNALHLVLDRICPAGNVYRLILRQIFLLLIFEITLPRRLARFDSYG